MDVEHDNDRTASLILQEIEDGETGGECSISPSPKDTNFSKNIHEQVKDAEGPLVTEVETIKDPETEVGLEKGDTAVDTLKKAIENRIYRPQIPPGHLFEETSLPRVKYNKAKFKELEEGLTVSPE